MKILIGILSADDASQALDPQIHTHAVIVNATFDPVRGRVQALTDREIARAIRYAGKVHQNELACNVRELGYEIDLTRKKGEILAHKCNRKETENHTFKISRTPKCEKFWTLPRWACRSVQTELRPWRALPHALKLKEGSGRSSDRAHGQDDFRRLQRLHLGILDVHGRPEADLAQGCTRLITRFPFPPVPRLI